MIEEGYGKDKIIEKTTTNFYSKVEAMQKDFNISLEPNDFDQINDFLYLINANYYEKIVSTLPQYCREEIIDKIVNQAGLYLEGKDKSSFNRKDVLNILNNCYFIKDGLKKEIYQEFIASEVSFIGWIGHGIENRNVDILKTDTFLEQKKKELSQRPVFDIESVDEYKRMIQMMIAKDDYLEQFGDVSELEWDIDSLKEFVCIMLKEHRKEIISYDDKLSNFEIAASYIYNAMCYAVVNQRKEVGPKEFFHTLKNWELLSWEIRCNFANDVVEKMNLKEESSFYKKAEKSKVKVISFNKQNKFKK